MRADNSKVDVQEKKLGSIYILRLCIACHGNLVWILVVLVGSTPLIE